MNQIVTTLMQEIQSTTSEVPLVIRARAPRLPPGYQLEGGMPMQGEEVYEYVLLEALPPELRERVITAIQAQLR